MTRVVAHIVRESGLLTEPFIARRVNVSIAGITTIQWWEQGAAPDGVPATRVPSRLIRPGSTAAKAFHHIPVLGARQRTVYRELADQQQPDLVHAHYLTTGYLAARIGRPLVVSAYGFDVSVMPRRRLWRRAYRELAGAGAWVLVAGPGMHDAVVALGFASDRVRIVRIAVGHETLAFNLPRPLDARPPSMLAAGRFVEKKGLSLAIRAFVRMGERHPGAVLRVVGSGPLDAELRQLATSLGRPGTIEFLGSLSRDSYLAQVRDADLLLAPSITARNGDMEGATPTTILDAHAVGTIVVASRHADIPFFVEDGSTGFLAPEGDEDGLVDAVERALAGQDLWPKIAAAARAQILQHHSDAALAAGLSDAYQEALR